MIVVYGDWLLCTRGFEPGENGKKKDISVKEKSIIFRWKTHPTFGCNISFINPPRLNGFNKVEKNGISQNQTW